MVLRKEVNDVFMMILRGNGPQGSVLVNWCSEDEVAGWTVINMHSDSDWVCSGILFLLINFCRLLH